MKLALSYLTPTAWTQGYISPNSYIPVIVAISASFYPTNFDCPATARRYVLTESSWNKCRKTSFAWREEETVYPPGILPLRYHELSFEDAGILYSGNPFKVQTTMVKALCAALLNPEEIASLIVFIHLSGATVKHKCWIGNRSWTAEWQDFNLTCLHAGCAERPLNASVASIDSFLYWQNFEPL